MDEAADLDRLPIHFLPQDFGAIYRRNFSKSNVVVHRVVNLVYFLSIGLESYLTERTMDRNPIKLF